jgi:hypothetical protein
MSAAAVVDSSLKVWMLNTANTPGTVLVTGLQKTGAAVTLTAVAATATLAAGSKNKFTGAAGQTLTLAAATATAAPIEILNNSLVPVSVAGAFPGSPKVLQPGMFVRFVTAGTTWVEG